MMALEPGLTGQVKLTVGANDTAIALGSGEVAVLGTPRVVALCEEASVGALAGRLGAGTTTVGMRVQLDHMAPSMVGTVVVADASLERVEGRRLTFHVSVSDERGLLAVGKVTRVIVDIDAFMDKAR